MPWALIPFLLLLSFGFRFDVGLELNIAWNIKSLLIPVSAWIGYHYGPAGVKTVFYTCIPLFLLQFQIGDRYFHIDTGANGGTLFAALAISWLLSSTESLDRLRSYLAKKKRRLWWLAILPLTFSIYDRLERDLFVTFWMNSSLSLYTSLFIIGLVLPRVEFRRIWRTLSVMFFVGVGCLLLMIKFGDNITYAFYQPRTLVSALIFLSAGYWCRCYRDDGALPRGPMSLRTPALLIGLMIFGYLSVGATFPFINFDIDITGERDVVFLCFFLAGLLYRKRGFLIVIGPAIVLSVLSLLFAELGPLTRGLPVGISVFSPSIGQAAIDLILFFLWTCVGGQVRAFLRGEITQSVATGAPARLGVSNT